MALGSPWIVDDMGGIRALKQQPATQIPAIPAAVHAIHEPSATADRRSTVVAVVLVSDGVNDNIETTGTTRTTLGGAPPAVHEAAAEHDTGADDGARSGQGSRAHPQGRRLTSVLDGPEATPGNVPDEQRR
jgi:hypothetical protein